MDWLTFTKRYVWDEEKTPYLTAVSQLTRQQAHREVFAYGLLLGMFFAVLLLATMLSLSAGIDAIKIIRFAYTGLTVICAIALIQRKYPNAARWCALSPLLFAIDLLLSGFDPKLELIDKIFLLLILLGTARYGRRIVAIARGYAGLRCAPTATTSQPQSE